MGECPKVYVEVKVRYYPDGRMEPLAVVWEDGREYGIARVTDVRRAASLKAGGVGMRYTVRIGTTETYLYLEESRWFVERRGE